MREQDLIEQWKREERQPFSGWDFSHLKDRYIAPTPPWSYEEKVRVLLREADSVVDLGTGGGEKLLEFKDFLPVNTLATEGWAPNIEVARAKLSPYGIQVVPYNIETETRMPFGYDTFALVIDRHEAFDASEVTRILKTGGRFLTQQVDGRSLIDLSSAFGWAPPDQQVTLAVCGKDVEQAGLSIEFAGEWMGEAHFSDVGAIVYFAHAAPWHFPQDFSVERYAKPLLDLHRRGRLSFDMGYFIIQAYKPSSSRA